MPRVTGHGVGPWKHHVGPAELAGPFIGSVTIGNADTAQFDPNDQAANISQNLPLAAENVGRTITCVNVSTAGAFTLNLATQGGNILNDAGGVAAAIANGLSVTVQAINATTWQVISRG